MVKRLAEEGYEERVLPAGTLVPGRLVKLAGVLEEAGAAAELLGHLRRPGPHVRGCWLRFVDCQYPDKVAG